MIVWSRPPVLGALFCAVRELGASVVTYCRGRWEPSDQDEHSAEPPIEERCGACAREVAEVDPEGILDPTWTGEGPRRARERLERKRGTK